MVEIIPLSRHHSQDTTNPLTHSVTSHSSTSHNHPLPSILDQHDQIASTSSNIRIQISTPMAQVPRSLSTSTCSPNQPGIVPARTTSRSRPTTPPTKARPRSFLARLKRSTTGGDLGSPTTGRTNSIKRHLHLQQQQQQEAGKGKGRGKASMNKAVTGMDVYPQEGNDEALGQEDAHVDEEEDDFDWEAEWERIRTLPRVRLVPPEDEGEPVTLYPPPHPRLPLPQLERTLSPPSLLTSSLAASLISHASIPNPTSSSQPPTSPMSNRRGPSRFSTQASEVSWKRMADGFVLPPPTFSRHGQPGAGMTVVMPKTKRQVEADIVGRRMSLVLMDGDESHLGIARPCSPPPQSPHGRGTMSSPPPEIPIMNFEYNSPPMEMEGIEYTSMMDSPPERTISPPLENRHAIHFEDHDSPKIDFSASPRPRSQGSDKEGYNGGLLALSAIQVDTKYAIAAIMANEPEDQDLVILSEATVEPIEISRESLPTVIESTSRQVDVKTPSIPTNISSSEIHRSSSPMDPPAQIDLPTIVAATQPEEQEQSSRKKRSKSLSLGFSKMISSKTTEETPGDLVVAGNKTKTPELKKQKSLKKLFFPDATPPPAVPPLPSLAKQDGSQAQGKSKSKTQTHAQRSSMEIPKGVDIQHRRKGLLGRTKSKPSLKIEVASSANSSRSTTPSISHPGEPDHQIGTTTPHTPALATSSTTTTEPYPQTPSETSSQNAPMSARGLIKRFSLSNMSSAFKKKQSISSVKDILPNGSTTAIPGSAGIPQMPELPAMYRVQKEKGKGKGKAASMPVERVMADMTARRQQAGSIAAVRPETSFQMTSAAGPSVLPTLFSQEAIEPILRPSKSHSLSADGKTDSPVQIEQKPKFKEARRRSTEVVIDLRRFSKDSYQPLARPIHPDSPILGQTPPITAPTTRTTPLSFDHSEHTKTTEAPAQGISPLLPPVDIISHVALSSLPSPDASTGHESAVTQDKEAHSAVECSTEQEDVIGDDAEEDFDDQASDSISLSSFDEEPAIIQAQHAHLVSASPRTHFSPGISLHDFLIGNGSSSGGCFSPATIISLHQPSPDYTSRNNTLDDTVLAERYMGGIPMQRDIRYIPSIGDTPIGPASPEPYPEGMPLPPSPTTPNTITSFSEEMGSPNGEHPSPPILSSGMYPTPPMSRRHQSVSPLANVTPEVVSVAESIQAKTQEKADTMEQIQPQPSKPQSIQSEDLQSRSSLSTESDQFAPTTPNAPSNTSAAASPIIPEVDIVIVESPSTDSHIHGYQNGGKGRGPGVKYPGVPHRSSSKPSSPVTATLSGSPGGNNTSTANSNAKSNTAHNIMHRFSPDVMLKRWTKRNSANSSSNKDQIQSANQGQSSSPMASPRTFNGPGGPGGSPALSARNVPLPTTPEGQVTVPAEPAQTADSLRKELQLQSLHFEEFGRDLVF